MWKPIKYRPPYDPLAGLPDGAIALESTQAEALRHILELGNLHVMYGESAEELAREYRMYWWLRGEVLIGPDDKLTRKGTASLYLFDHPPTEMEIFRGRRDVDEEAIEDEEFIHDARITVTLADDAKINVRLTQSPALEWVAEASVGAYGTKRKRRLRTHGNDKSTVLHTLIKKASEFREKSYVDTFSHR